MPAKPRQLLWYLTKKITQINGTPKPPQINPKIPKMFLLPRNESSGPDSPRRREEE